MSNPVSRLLVNAHATAFATLLTVKSDLFGISPGRRLDGAKLLRGPAKAPPALSEKEGDDNDDNNDNDRKHDDDHAAGCDAGRGSTRLLETNITGQGLNGGARRGQGKRGHPISHISCAEGQGLITRTHMRPWLEHGGTADGDLLGSRAAQSRLNAHPHSFLAPHDASHPEVRPCSLGRWDGQPVIKEDGASGKKAGRNCEPAPGIHADDLDHAGVDPF